MAHERRKEKGRKWDVQVQPVEYKIWEGETGEGADRKICLLARPLGTGLLKACTVTRSQ